MVGISVNLNGEENVFEESREVKEINSLTLLKPSSKIQVFHDLSQIAKGINFQANAKKRRRTRGLINRSISYYVRISLNCLIRTIKAARGKVMYVFGRFIVHCSLASF